ncbi:MAG: type II CAAX prenyl endopeptidase Rce1 family protein, partial [Armatimonadota bacterium]
MASAGSAALFAVVHPPLSMLPVFIMGLLAALAFERTRLLVHLVDIRPTAGDPAAEYRAIRAELQRYSPALAGKP